MCQVRRITSPRGVVSYETSVDSQTKVIYLERKHEPPSIAIGFVCSGSWYYQSLMWSCRGGKAKYFRALVGLYRYLRRNRITEHSLRYLAWGENRLKNGLAVQ